MKPSLDDAIALDETDELANLKQQFEIPPDKIYLDGNSLGPLLSSTKRSAIELIETQWGKDLVSSWNQHGWIDLPLRCGEKIAKLIGAAPGQVICCDSVSVNLFKLLHCATQLNPERNIILSQTDNFPTDLYVAEGMERLLDSDNCKIQTVKESEIEQHLQSDIAVLMLTHVNFRSGKMHDIQRLTEAAHTHGIIVIWDLAHSAGVVPLNLDQWGVDFAVGCGYKYLNGGPGAPAFIYAAERHQAHIKQPLQGWMGHMAPFDFCPEYIAADNMLQFLCGTPPIISMAALNSALNIYENLPIESVRKKSIALSSFFQKLVSSMPELEEFTLLSPVDHEQRGSQLAYSHPYAYAICQNLIDNGVVADFRNPDILRFGFSPLFLSFENIYQSTQTLSLIVSEKSYLNPKYNDRLKVT